MRLCEFWTSTANDEACSATVSLDPPTRCSSDGPAPVAQGIERRFPKPCVAGSNPAGGAVTGVPQVREEMVDGGDPRLFVRQVGEGRPIVVVHGGPDFDHEYLLRAVTRRASSFHLIYYDQRGRGRSYDGAPPRHVSMATEVDDLERVRTWCGVDTVAVLGHSWGGLLALEYALRNPDHVSHLVLMNSAPASHADFALLCAEISRR